MLINKLSFFEVPFMVAEDDLYTTLCSLIDAGAKGIALNARDYGKVRRFGRNILDLESKAMFLKLGRMATLHGTTIFVNKYVDPGSFWGYFEDNRYPYQEVGLELPPAPSIIAGSNRDVLAKYGNFHD